MLKAVCLDEKEHKHLIDFIEQYKDENNKANISSAIRFLMIKGYESLQQKESMQKELIQKELMQKEILQRKSLEQQSSNNKMEEIKREVTEQVINKLQTQLLESNSQLINVLISTLVKNKTTEQESILQQLLQLMQKQQYYQPQPQPQIIPFMQYQPFYQQQPFANNDQFYQSSSSQPHQQQQDKNSIKTESKIIPNISVESSEIAQANIKQDETGLLANLLSNANR